MDELSEDLFKTDESKTSGSGKYPEIPEVTNPDQVIISNSNRVSQLTRAQTLELIDAYIKKSQLTESLKLAQTLSAKDDQDFVATYRVGFVYLKLRKLKEAQASFRAAIAINPKYDAAYSRISEILFEKVSRLKAGTKNAYYELRNLYSDWMTAVGERPYLIERNCYYQAQSGLFEEAKPICLKASSLLPDDPTPKIQLLLIEKDTLDSKSYMQKFYQIAQKHPRSFSAQMSVAKEAEQQRDFINAETYYKKANLIDPKSVDALAGWSRSLVALNKIDEALATYKKACGFTRDLIPDMRKAVSFLRIHNQIPKARNFDEAIENCVPPRRE